ncbi:MAG: hypothetical protein ACUVTG_15680 [Candidatus Oleimicrobiaceae bacterium]
MDDRERRRRHAYADPVALVLVANERLSLCLGYGSRHGGGISAAAVLGSHAGACGIQLGKPHFNCQHDGGRSSHLPPHKAVVACFYRVTRLFGFWGPAKATLPAEVRERQRGELLGDIISFRVAVPWQLVLLLFWMMRIMRRWDQLVRGDLVACPVRRLVFHLVPLPWQRADSRRGRRGED